MGVGVHEVGEQVGDVLRELRSKVAEEKVPKNLFSFGKAACAAAAKYLVTAADYSSTVGDVNVSTLRNESG